MISAIILMPAAGAPAGPGMRPDQLARAFSALVPAVIEGLVTDVVLVGPAFEGAHRVVADHAGCDLLEAADEASGIRAALARSGRPRALVLKAPYVPEDGFIEEVGWLMRDPTAAALLLRERRRRIIFPGPIVGVIAPRAALAGLKRPDFPSLARVKPARILNARARRVT